MLFGYVDFEPMLCGLSWQVGGFINQDFGSIEMFAWVGTHLTGRYDESSRRGSA